MNRWTWSEAEVIRRCVERQPDAWEAFVERFGDGMFGVIRSQCRKLGLHDADHTAEEIFQDVFSELIKGNALKNLRDPLKINGFLRAICVSRTIDAFRRQKREFEFRFIPDSTAEDNDGEEWIWNLPDPNAASPISGETERLIDEALRPMPVADELAFRFKWQHRMARADIAKALGMTETSVAATLRKVRERLKMHLKQKGALPDDAA